MEKESCKGCVRVLYVIVNGEDKANTIGYHGNAPWAIESKFHTNRLRQYVYVFENMAKIGRNIVK